MNHQLIQEFVNKIRATVKSLNLEILKTNIDAKDALAKFKSSRADMTNLYNLLKIEADLSKDRAEEG